MDLSYLPEKLEKMLLPFQREGIEYAIKHGGRCLIADEMGLGKTLQAIAAAYYYKSEWPVLILMPASLKYQWVEEVEKWLPELLPSDINILTNSFDVGNVSKCAVNIVSYSLLRYGNPNKSLLLKAIKAQKFKVIIADESHNIKNKKSRTSNLVVDLVLSCKRCFMLSGTPAMNKPAELYTQINALQPNRFGTWNDYTLRYCDARYVQYGRAPRVWTVDGAKNLDELEHKLKQYLMIRRLKKDVLKQLPPKRRQRILFDLKFNGKCSELEKELTDLQEELDKVMNSTGVSLAQAVTHTSEPQDGAAPLPVMFDMRRIISLLYQKTCEAKVGPVIEFVMLYAGPDQSKVLVFAHHKKMMDSIQESLNNAHVKHIRIDGSVNAADRNMLVKQFQSDDNTRVALLSILAAGVGLTLTAASVVVFAELYWTPAILMQCEDRAHRIGQTAHSVNIYYLVARGTVDERIWSLVERKTRVLSMTLDGCKGSLVAKDGSKHVTNLISSAAIKKAVTVVSEDEVEQDINVADFFNLADLKRKHQPTLSEFLSPSSQQARKKQKKLILPGKPEVLTLDSDSDDEGTTNHKQDFMAWAIGADSSPTRSDNDSLPSLDSVDDIPEPVKVTQSNRKSPTSETCANLQDAAGSDDPGENTDDLFSDNSDFNDTIIEQSVEQKNDKPQCSTVEKPLSKEEDFNDAVCLLTSAKPPNEWICLSCRTSNAADDECCNNCALPQLDTSWTCPLCATVNPAEETSCDECFTEREDKSDDNHDKESIDPNKILKHDKFYFLVSPHTSRVFLFDKNKEYLKASFHGIDIDNPDKLPDILQRSENLILAQNFVKSWNQLKKREQKMLVKKAELLCDPEEAYHGEKHTKVKTKQRYKSKADVGEAAKSASLKNPGGTLRHITKPVQVGDKLILPPTSSSDKQGYLQAVMADETPMCIKCQEPLSTELLKKSQLTDEVNGWQTRFCSAKCSDQFWMVTSNSYLRDATKQLDGGVCEICGVDAQAIFKKILCTSSWKSRCEILQNSCFASLSASVKESMVKSPKEGQFWHADHVIPVYAGGGESDIDNLRTLCTVCHRLVTSDQATARARARRLGPAQSNLLTHVTANQSSK